MAFFSDLAAFDWLVLLIVGSTALIGLMRGFIAEVASLAAWIAGFVAVRLFHAPARAAFLEASDSEMLAAIAAVLVPFLVALLAVRLLGGLLARTAKDSVVGPFDRLLGLGFGLVKGVLAAGLMFLIITLALKLVPGEGERPRWLAEAKTRPTLALVASAMVAYVGDLWREEVGDVAAEPGDDPHAGLPGPSRDEDGYRPEDRRSLDRLLDKQEQETPSTPI
ncbi:CvpA family protein [Sandarakinorhabdus rubra]|uniref:CvpA family protein n=1 Tax=Sandarakinorhabdus rubra TaxID=2672568 RepID=UPI0013D906F3|nr:CvpA family protein [Sandarakinorhabdus rubra]